MSPVRWSPQGKDYPSKVLRLIGALYLEILNRGIHFSFKKRFFSYVIILWYDRLYYMRRINNHGHYMLDFDVLFKVYDFLKKTLPNDDRYIKKFFLLYSHFHHNDYILNSAILPSFLWFYMLLHFRFSS